MTAPLRVDAIDLSHWQAGHLDFPAARRDGVKGVWHKTTESTTSSDNRYAQRRRECATAKIPFGAYHFARPSKSNGTSQARRFLSQAGVHPGDLRPMLDLEDRGGLSRAQLTRWVRDFVAVVVDQTGVHPFIYTPFDLDDTCGCPLWVARYSNANAAPRVPAPWKTATMRQFSDGRYGVPNKVAGIGHVDLDHLNTGTITDHVIAAKKPAAAPAKKTPAKRPDPHGFALTMPAKRPAIGHSDRWWEGDTPRIFTISPAVYRDLNFRLVWHDPKHRDSDHGVTARNLHATTARGNRYTHVLNDHGVRRPMTPAELDRPLDRWTDEQVNRWQRPIRTTGGRVVGWESPHSYADLARTARRLGRVICAELKDAEFATPWIARQIVAAAKAADHPPWFTRLYHNGGTADLAREITRAGGDLAVIFGRYQHERAAYATRVRSWPVRPSAVW